MNYSDDFGERSGARSAFPTYAAVVALLLFTFPTITLAYSFESFQDHADKILARTEISYGEMADIAAMLHDYDKKTILAVIVVESEGNPKAVSNRGAQGLMQLMPGTAKAMGATNPKEPFDNILAGTKYLKHLEDVYGFDSIEKSLVAYNMGPTKAKRWLSQYDAEDNSYVKKVMYVRGLLEERELDEARMRAIATSGPSDDMIATAFAAVKVRAGTLFTKPRTLSMVTIPDGMTNVRRTSVVTE